MQIVHYSQLDIRVEVPGAGGDGLIYHESSDISLTGILGKWSCHWGEKLMELRLKSLIGLQRCYGAIAKFRLQWRYFKHLESGTARSWV